MQSAADRFVIAHSVRWHTDDDGSAILNIQRDKIYNLIGVGSVMWEWIASSPEGLTSIEIAGLLSAQFGEVPRPRIEADAERLLTSFHDHGLIVVNDMSGRLTRSIAGGLKSAYLSLACGAVCLASKLRLHTLAAFLGLVTVTLTLKLLGFSTLYSIVKAWPVSRKRTARETAGHVCDSVVRAMGWYPKQAWCLQRSALATCLLRSRGVPAQMVIGCQKLPFLAHAWVEVSGVVVNDNKRVQETHLVLDRW